MKARVCWVLAGVVALGEISLAQSAAKRDAGPGFGKEKLIGAWHLVSISAQGRMEDKIPQPKSRER